MLQQRQLAAVFAGFWFVELVAQAIAIAVEGLAAWQFGLLVLLAALVSYFTLLSVKLLTRARQRMPFIPIPLSARVSAAEIRGQLTDLGLRRLGGELSEPEFLAERDEILRPLTTSQSG